VPCRPRVDRDCRDTSTYCTAPLLDLNCILYSLAWESLFCVGVQCAQSAFQRAIVESRTLQSWVWLESQFLHCTPTDDLCSLSNLCPSHLLACIFPSWSPPPRTRLSTVARLRPESRKWNLYNLYRHNWSRICLLRLTLPFLPPLPSLLSLDFPLSVPPQTSSCMVRLLRSHKWEHRRNGSNIHRAPLRTPHSLPSQKWNNFPYRWTPLSSPLIQTRLCLPLLRTWESCPSRFRHKWGLGFLLTPPFPLISPTWSP
jgi:hypothetical protein